MDLEERLAALTEAEREALRLFLKHSDVNLIARALGISTSAVDKRLLSARRKLGVGRSVDAALLLAQQEGTGRTVQVAFSPASEKPASPATPGLPERSPRRWPELFPTRERPWNTMPVWARLVFMACLVLLITIAVLVEVSVQTVWPRPSGAEVGGHRHMQVLDSTAPVERRMSPVRALQTTIQGHEKTIDEALASSSDVLGRALRLGLLAGTMPAVSQQVVEELVSSLNAGVAMRTANLKAHKMMDTIAKTINFRELGYGDGVYKPEITPDEDGIFVPRHADAPRNA